MTIKEYQQYVEEGANPIYTQQLALLGLVGEVGELSDVVKKQNIYSDMSRFEQKYGMTVKEKICDEAGDVLWQYMLVLCKYGLSIEDVIACNVEKLNKRHGGAGRTASDGGGVR